ncbi:hypothetical protein PVAP13_6NG147703 [Panicum virgatum]|uniref:Uncharacterized protein n=1 Tax=Panicum virgatum TaxID=38727 RepID=A0A8T0R0M4_PANVG|nr:hypothetical protein PVAP13_6NG147703 [Panicum virgatum]
MASSFELKPTYRPLERPGRSALNRVRALFIFLLRPARARRRLRLVVKLPPFLSSTNRRRGTTRRRRDGSALGVEPLGPPEARGGTIAAPTGGGRCRAAPRLRATPFLSPDAAGPCLYPATRPAARQVMVDREARGECPARSPRARGLHRPLRPRGAGPGLE